jgi:hypothetical protein
MKSRKSQPIGDPFIGIGAEPNWLPPFPMKFRKFLRIAFGGRLHDERLHLFRKCVHASSVRTERNSRAAERKTADVIAKLNREGITDPDWYLSALEIIKAWRAKNRIEQRRQAAKARWKKCGRIPQRKTPEKRRQANAETYGSGNQSIPTEGASPSR